MVAMSSILVGIFSSLLNAAKSMSWFFHDSPCGQVLSKTYYHEALEVKKQISAMLMSLAPASTGWLPLAADQCLSIC